MPGGGSGRGFSRRRPATRTILRATSVVPLALGLGAAACGPGRLARDGRYVDLLRAFASAERAVSELPAGKTVDDFAHVQVITCGGRSLTALFVHPPARVAFDLTVGPGAILDTAVGVADDATGSDGVTFFVEAERRGGALRLLQRRVDPRQAADRRWHPVRIDLSQLAGEEIRLVLRTERAADATADWAGFASPQVVSDGVPRPAPPFGTRSVVLLSLDTLRVDRLGAFGHAEPSTPRLDALLRRSRLYPDAHAPSHWTLPSHASLMSGTHADVHRAAPDRAVDAGLPMLAEVLAARGYRTAAFAADIGWLDPKFGFARGFHTYHLAVEPSARRIRRLRAHLETLRGRRVLLWAHLFDAHSDDLETAYEASPEAAYLAGLAAGSCAPCGGRASEQLLSRNAKRERLPPAEEEILRRAYGAGVFDLDHEVGRLLSELGEAGLLPSAALVTFSDHGEELGDHGMYLHDQAHPETSQGLLAIRLPGDAQGRLVGGLPTLVDVAPTIADFTGAGRPGAWQGTSLLRHVPDQAYLVTQRGGSILRRPGRTFVLGGNGAQAFDRLRDPGEMQPEPVAADAVELLGVRALREAHAAMAERLRGGAPVTISPEEIQKLRGLGYNQ